MAHHVPVTMMVAHMVAMPVMAHVMMTVATDLDQIAGSADGAGQRRGGRGGAGQTGDSEGRQHGQRQK